VNEILQGVIIIGIGGLVLYFIGKKMDIKNQDHSDDDIDCC